MEMHFVHFNTNYGSRLAEVVAKSKGAYDTLAVLSVFFQIQSKDNPNFNPLIKGEQIESSKITT